MAMYHNIEIDNLAICLLAEDGKDNPTTEEKAAKVAVIKLDILRGERNQRLIDADWLVIKANETGTSVPDEWKTYRQALRDLPKHSKWPHLESSDWPTKPS